MGTYIPIGCQIFMRAWVAKAAHNAGRFMKLSTAELGSFILYLIGEDFGLSTPRWLDGLVKSFISRDYLNKNYRFTLENYRFTAFLYIKKLR